MKVKIYGSPRCKYCVKAKELCEINDIKYDWVDIGEDHKAKAYLKEELKATTIPQIFVDGTLVGGYDDFRSFLSE